MNCPSCNHDNRPGRKFCGACGGALPRPCPACGTENEAGENFCGECGAPLAAAAPPRSPREDQPPAAADAVSTPGRAAFGAGARKVVSVVFADLVGSTALHERVDAESARRLMERYYLALRRAVEANGGTVVKLLGDGVMAAYGLHQVSEDDALKAVRGAAAMQDAFRALVSAEGAVLGSVGLRVAVNTGEVVVAAGEDDVVGDPVNVAARLQEQGRDGDVVIGESTRRLVSTRVTLEPLGSVTLKGRAEAVAAHRLVSLEPPAGAVAAPFVGRDDELARLEQAFSAASGAPATRLAVLLGSPGLGKSRLINEFRRRREGGASILAAHCDAAGGATFAPLAAALRLFLGVADETAGQPLRQAVAAAMAGAGDDQERARIADGIVGLLSGAAASPEETFFVVRRFLASLAGAAPVVLVVDDVHWAEPLLLDLVEHLVQWGSGVPLFVLVGARPELRDLRSSLVTPGGIAADVITLGGLDAGAAMRLAAGVIGASDLPASVAARVLATSEGNPLFVGELIRMLVQEGALARDGDRWTAGANLAALEMPPTIHALLAARIERLRPEERGVLERAAVVGRHFSRGAVAALLLGESGRPAEVDAGELDARLEALRRSELIERDGGWFLGEPALRFHHVLIRDAAYRRLLKGTRAGLHSRLADWIEGRVGDAPEQDETIGRHLEQACHLLRELDGRDPAAVALGERAARRLASAGRRALARDDVELAGGLLGRALALLGPTAPGRSALLLDHCEALLAAGDVGSGTAAVAELDAMATRASAPAGAADDGREGRRLRAWHTCFAGHLTVLASPEDLHATADRVGSAAADLAALGETAGEAKAHFVHAQALARLGKIGASEAALDLALAAARRAGDRRRANAVLAGAPPAALWGPSPVTRASGRCLDVVRVLRITQGAPAVEAVALGCQGVLEAMRGRIDAARRMLASSRAMVEQLGIAHRLHETDVFAGRIDLLEGDAPAAERALRRGYEGLRDLGLGIDAARAAALLGRALLAQDRAAEAEALSHESERLAGDDLQAAIAWRVVRAEALARSGDHAAAIEMAEAAVAIAEATDALLDHADARLALAAALRAGGRRAEADDEEQRAAALWETKGATLLAERARRDVPAKAAKATGPAGTRTEQPPPNRRLTPNTASEAIVEFNVYTPEDFRRLIERISQDYVETDHPTGVTYGRDGAIESMERHMRSADAVCLYEPRATLGETLVLCRRRVSASATGGRNFDVGAYEQYTWTIVGIDATGRMLEQEVFADDRLADAIVRLYQRHAELLPDGPARTRAARTARSHAVFYSPDTDGAAWLATLAPDLESVDHRQLGSWAGRGADAFAAHMRALHLLAENVEFRVVDLVALHPDVQLQRILHTGTDRASGGAYERPFLRLIATGPEGLRSRIEWFDDDCEAQALARFDAVVAGNAPPDSPRRPPEPNAATAALARFREAELARDLGALERTMSPDIEVVHHATGTTYGLKGMLATWRSMFRATRMERRQEEVATLGGGLALGRHTISIEGLAENHLSAFGSVEIDEVVLTEVDGEGRIRRFELFPTERLGTAVVRLCELSAESDPDPARARRSRSIASSIAVFEGPIDLDRVATAHRADVEIVDHRVLGTWSARGREEWMRHWQGQFGLADDSAVRHEEVLALGAGAFLCHQTFHGTDRTSGGYFENVILALNVFDDDGLIAHTEVFDTDARAAALARFDDLSDGGRGRRAASREAVGPRVPALNRASSTLRAFEAAFAAADQAALAALFDPALVVVDHPNAATYGLDGHLASLARLLRADDPELTAQPLATLGDDLVLWRRRIRASGASGGRFDVGEFEREEFVVFALGADGTGAADAGATDAGATGAGATGAGAAGADAAKVTRIEVHAREHLNDALGQLFSLHAASFPEGPERDRFSGMAARYLPTEDVAADDARLLDRYDEGFVCFDHRSLRTWSAEGREAWIRHVHSQLELSTDVFSRTDDILAFTPFAQLTRQIFGGTNRASGGAYENVFLSITVFSREGRTERLELFEPEDQAAAFARFDQLVGGAPGQPLREAEAHPFANAASRADAALFRSFHARDWAAIEALAAPDLVFDERRRLVRNACGRDVWLEQFRVLFDVPGARFTTVLRATRGDRLSLNFHRFEGQAPHGGGPLAMDDHLALHEVDGEGRIRRIVLFDLEDEEAALDELDALWHAGDEAARSPMVARFLAGNRLAHQSRDWKAYSGLYTPEVVLHDRRLVGFGVLRGLDRFVATQEDLVKLAPDVRVRVPHVRATERGLLAELHQQGTREGGRFESTYLWTAEFDTTGLVLRADLYDPRRFDEASRRFAQLAAADEPFANAATRAVARVARATEAQDWDALADTVSTDLLFDDRRALLRMQLGREGFLEQHRILFDAPNARWKMTTLATRGERLSLSRIHFFGNAADGGGDLEIEHLGVLEADDDGRMRLIVLFEPSDLAAARAELDVRWQAGSEAAAHQARARFSAAAHTRLAARDWDGLAALFAPTLLARDHRLVGWDEARGPEALVRTMRTMVDLAPDAEGRLDHLRISGQGLFAQIMWTGSHDGGSFESPFLWVVGFDAAGLAERLDFYDLRHFEEARARYAGIANAPGEPNRVAGPAGEGPGADPILALLRPNLASTAMDRWVAAYDRCFDTGDWEAMRSLAAPGYEFHDRRRLVLLDGGVDLLLAAAKERASIGARMQATVIGTFGERVAMHRVLWSGGPADGRFEIEYLGVVESDEAGRLTCQALFDTKDALLARRYATQRWSAIDDVSATVAAFDVLAETFNSKDFELAKPMVAEDIVFDDRRRTGVGRIEGIHAYVPALQALWELAPDAHLELGWVWLAALPGGGVTAFRRFGTLPEGGDYVSEFLALILLDATGRINHFELLELDAAEAAPARLAQLLSAARG